MARITIYSTGSCPLCGAAKNVLTKWKISFREVRVDHDKMALREMLEITNQSRTVPQILIDERWIGGFFELTQLHMDGELDYLVNGEDGDARVNNEAGVKG